MTRAVPHYRQSHIPFEAALASRRQFTRHLGMGISLLAAFVLSVVEITGLLCSDRHARRTEIYGVGASRNTQSHCKARASSRRRPAYKPIMVNRYGGSPLTVSSSTSTCWSVSESFFWGRFPSFCRNPLTRIVFQQLAPLCRVKNALEEHIHRIVQALGLIGQWDQRQTISSAVTSSIYISPKGLIM